MFTTKSFNNTITLQQERDIQTNKPQHFAGLIRQAEPKMTVEQYRQHQQQQLVGQGQQQPQFVGQHQLICQEEQRRSPKTVEQLISQVKQQPQFVRQQMTVEQYRQHQQEQQMVGQQERQLIRQAEPKMTVEQYRQHKQEKWVAQQQEHQLIRQGQQQPQLVGQQQLICQEEQRRSSKNVEQLILQEELCRQEVAAQHCRKQQQEKWVAQQQDQQLIRQGQQQPQLICQEEQKLIRQAEPKMTVEQYRQCQQEKWVAQQEEQQLIRQGQQQPLFVEQQLNNLLLCGEQQQQHMIEQLVKQLIKQQRSSSKLLPRSQSLECFISQSNSSLTAQVEETPLCKLVKKIIAGKQQLNTEETLEQMNVQFNVIDKVQKVLEQHHNMELSLREVSQLTIKQLSIIERHTELNLLKRQCQALFYFVEQCAQQHATEETRFVQELMKLATAEQRIRLTLRKLMNQQAKLDLSQTEETLYTLLHKVNTVAKFNQMPTLKYTQVLLVKPAQHQTENRQGETVKEQRVELFNRCL